MNINYIKLLQVIESFSDSHLQVSRFKSDFLEQLPNFGTEANSFPILYVTPDRSVFNNDRFADLNTFTINVYCLDIIEKDRDNINTILNNTSLILNDLHKFFKDLTIPGIELVSSSAINPINNYTMDYAAGWFMSLTLELETYSVCDIPFSTPPIVSSCDCDITYNPYIGPTGPTGPTGIQGPTGPVGPNLLKFYPPGSQQVFNGETVPRSTGGVTMTGNRIYYIPMKLETEATFSSIYVRTGGITGVGSFVVGIYDINSTYTGDLLFQTIVGNASLPGQTLGNSNFTLQAGYYLLTWHADVTYSLQARESGLALFGNSFLNTYYRYAYKPLTYSATLPATMSLSGISYIVAGNTPSVAFNLI